MTLNRYDCTLDACDGSASATVGQAVAISGAGDRFLILSYHGVFLRRKACTRCYLGYLTCLSGQGLR